MSFVIEPTSDLGSVIVHIGPGLDFRNAAEFKKVCQEQVQAGTHDFRSGTGSTTDEVMV